LKRFNPPVALVASHQRKAFDCGDESLNIFIQKFALQNQKKDANRTYVVIDDDNQVIAYYSLVAGEVVHQAAPGVVKKGLAKHPIPVIVLAKLAVDVNYQGMGLGCSLLQDALKRALNVVQEIGVRAILVHAKNENAASFYRKFGFLQSPTDPLHYYLLVKDIVLSL